MIYRFRVQFEEEDDVCRDIDISATQTFEDLKSAILTAISFDNKHEFSFFTSDDFWRKGNEIGNKNEDATVGNYTELLLSDVINAPHQKFLFIYDLVTEWSFLVELVKIFKEEPKKIYPYCSKQIGSPPKQYKLVYIPRVVVEDDTVVKNKRGRKPGQIVAKKALIEELEDEIEDEQLLAIEEEIDLEGGFTEEGTSDIPDEEKEGEDDFEEMAEDEFEGHFEGEKDEF